MDATHPFAGVREPARGDGQRPRTVITGDPPVLRPSRLTDRVLARMQGASLDRELAAGAPPESSVLLAVRAGQIVAIDSRHSLAGSWTHLLRVARRLRGTNHPAHPIRCEQIIAAEPAVRELVRRLEAPLPVAARGVAMAAELLTDAGSPVYSYRSPVFLASALEAATAQLDPAIPLLTSWP